MQIVVLDDKVALARVPLLASRQFVVIFFVEDVEELEACFVVVDQLGLYEVSKLLGAEPIYTDVNELENRDGPHSLLFASFLFDQDIGNHRRSLTKVFEGPRYCVILILCKDPLF